MVHTALLADQCYLVQLLNYQEFIFHFLNRDSSNVSVWDSRFFPQLMGRDSGISTGMIWSRLLNSLKIWLFNLWFRFYKHSCFRVQFYDIQCLKIPALQHFLSPLMTSAFSPLCYDLLTCCFYRYHQVVQSQYKLENQSSFFQKLNMCLFFEALKNKPKKD